MAGHSKFANIKHKKERADSKRSKIFTKLGKEIVVAVKEGGSDPSLNAKLRDVIAKAKANNMPNENIDRGIKKAAGELGNVNYEAVVYEGYGPNGVAVIVEALTDNRNRTAANVRSAYTKGGGNMGQTGSVNFQFEKLGSIMIEKSNEIDEDELMMLVLDAGASDFVVGDDAYEVITEPLDLTKVLEVLKAQEIAVFSAEVSYLPNVTTELTDPLDIKKFTKMMDLLEDDDDVQSVSHNCSNYEG